MWPTRHPPIVEREDVDAIFGVLFDIRRELRDIRHILETMEKKRKRRSPNSEELDRRFEETSRLLEERIAYHRALIAREKARRQLPWYRRIFAA